MSLMKAQGDEQLYEKGVAKRTYRQAAEEYVSYKNIVDFEVSRKKVTEFSSLSLLTNT